DSDSDSETNEVPSAKPSKLDERTVLVFENLPKQVTMDNVSTILLKEAQQYGDISRIIPQLNVCKVGVVFSDPRDAEDAFENLSGKLLTFKTQNSTTRITEVK